MRQLYFLFIAILFAGCAESNSHSKGVIHDTIFVEKTIDEHIGNKLIGTFEIAKEPISKPQPIKYVTLNGFAKTPFPRIR